MKERRMRSCMDMLLKWDRENCELSRGNDRRRRMCIRGSLDVFDQRIHTFIQVWLPGGFIMGNRCPGSTGGMTECTAAVVTFLYSRCTGSPRNQNHCKTCYKTLHTLPLLCWRRRWRSPCRYRQTVVERRPPLTHLYITLNRLLKGRRPGLYTSPVGAVIFHVKGRGIVRSSHAHTSKTAVIKDKSAHTLRTHLLHRTAMRCQLHARQQE